eukprot:c20970_g1_i1 orf=382-1662(+)
MKLRRSGTRKGARHGLRRLMEACWTSPSSECECECEEEPEQRLLASVPDDVLLECLSRLPRESLPSSMTVCQKWRSLLKSAEYYEHREKVGRLESLLFVFGGGGTELASAVCYKRREGWESSLLFSPRALLGNEWLLDCHVADHALLHAQPAVVKHRIFILAVSPCPSWKNENHDCTIVYDVWTKSIERKSPMLCPRKKFACCVISNRIFVAGGSRRGDSSRNAIMDAEEYNPERNEWTPIANMPRKRYGCLGAAVDGIFYVIGGLKFGSIVGLSAKPYTYVGSMDSFNPKTNTWQKTRFLPMGGCVIACTVVASCIYMLSNHAVELSFWKYNTVNDSWTKIKPPPIPSPLRLDNRLKFSCVTVGTAVYIIQVSGSIDDILRRSGRQGRGLKEGLVLIYDTFLEEWSRGPNLPFVKAGASCAVVRC